MLQLRKSVLLVVLGLAGVPARATHEFSFGLNAAAAANGKLAANPPLPMLYYGKGERKFTVQPYVFNGKLDDEPSGGGVNSGEFKGWGAGGSWSHAFADGWGVYVFGMGSSVSSDRMRFDLQNPSPGQVGSDVSNVSASFQLLNVGIVRQFYRREGGRFTLPVFAGPLLVRAKFSQAARELNAQTGAVISDFDIEGDGTSLGFMAGVQAGIDVGDFFKLNPFLIVGAASSSVPYTVMDVREDVTAQQSSESMLPRARRGDPMEVTSGFGSIGMNLVYRPWGLSLNLTSPFLNLSSEKITLFSLAWSFGNYRK